MIHGDLKGVSGRSTSRLTTILTSGQPNILVDDTGHVRIADFGLARLTQNPYTLPDTSPHRGYSPQWTAPEVLEEKPHTKQADIFSFAMVMIEVRHERSTNC